jgi:hypothetical protein
MSVDIVRFSSTFFGALSMFVGSKVNTPFATLYQEIAQALPISVKCKFYFFGSSVTIGHVFPSHGGAAKGGDGAASVLVVMTESSINSSSL